MKHCAIDDAMLDFDRGARSNAIRAESHPQIPPSKAVTVSLSRQALLQHGSASSMSSMETNPQHTPLVIWPILTPLYVVGQFGNWQCRLTARQCCHSKVTTCSVDSSCGMRGCHAPRGSADLKFSRKGGLQLPAGLLLNVQLVMHADERHPLGLRQVGGSLHVATCQAGACARSAHA